MSVALNFDSAPAAVRGARRGRPPSEEVTRRWTSARAEVREGTTRELVAAHDIAAMRQESPRGAARRRV